MANARAKPIGRDTYHHGQLRSALIEVASEAINTFGPANTSLREVARRANVSPAAALHHFKDKSALFAAIAQKGFEDLIARRADLVRGISDPEARLRLYISAYIRFAVENPATIGLMFGPIIAPRERFPDLQETALKSFKALKAEIRGYLASRGVERDLDTATWAAWSAAHGLSLLLIDFPSSKDRPERLSDQKLIDAVTETVLRGIDVPDEAAGGRAGAADG